DRSQQLESLEAGRLVHLAGAAGEPLLERLAALGRDGQHVDRNECHGGSWRGVQGRRDVRMVPRGGPCTTMGAMPATETILATARRCVVAHRGTDGPGVAAVSCWSDGGGLWMLPARHPEMEAALRRDPSRVVWIPPETAGGTGVAIDGHARIFDTSDPIALALHAPATS